MHRYPLSRLTYSPFVFPSIPGYDWVGWKKRPSNSVNLVFTFDHVRTFSRVDIHTNNHYTKDIQVFKEAKIYFSNEEDKFGDDRFVDYRQGGERGERGRKEIILRRA